MASSKKHDRADSGDDASLGAQEQSASGNKRWREAQAEPAAGTVPRPRATSDFSQLELLPDELLKRVIVCLGSWEAWEQCRLPLVSRRLREVLASTEFDALVLRGRRIGLSRQLGVREAELESWAQRLQSGVLRLAAGGALEVVMHMWRPQRTANSGRRSDDESLQPSSSSSSAIASACSSSSLSSHGQELSMHMVKPFRSIIASIHGLRRFFAWHGDVVPHADTRARSLQAGTKTRHEYIGALLEALAPVAGTLEELSIRLQTIEVKDRQCLPRGPEREAIVAGLRRLTALRSLDLADCIGFSAELLDEIAPAIVRLRSLRVSHFSVIMRTNVWGYRSIDHSFPENASSQSDLASAIRRLCPILGELRVTFVDAGALEALCGIDGLRTFGIDGPVRALPEFASPRLEELEIVGYGRDEPAAALLHSIARIDTLRSLTLAGGLKGWMDFASATQLRSLNLAIGPVELSPECLAALPHFTALERLSIDIHAGLSQDREHLASSPGGLAAALTALAAALPSVPSLRSLLFVSPPSSHSVPLRGFAGWRLADAHASVLRAAKNTLEEYVREEMYPALEECTALAACTRLRRASLILAEPVGVVAASRRKLAALAPLASMAARPGPAPGDLVLARREGDESDWGAIRPLLGGRWRLE